MRCLISRFPATSSGRRRVHGSGRLAGGFLAPDSQATGRDDAAVEVITTGLIGAAVLFAQCSCERCNRSLVTARKDQHHDRIADCAKPGTSHAQEEAEAVLRGANATSTTASASCSRGRATCNSRVGPFGRAVQAEQNSATTTRLHVFPARKAVVGPLRGCFRIRRPAD